MSIITFTNNENKETGQTFSAAAIGAYMAITHNYKILVMSTDFDDDTLEKCFFYQAQKRTKKVTNSLWQVAGGGGATPAQSDISNGMEGLIRAFASNKAEASIIKNYTKPVLAGRLDILPAANTVDKKEYDKMSVYFSQIAEYANKVYDWVIVDLNHIVPEENKQKIYNMSSLILYGLRQDEESINNFIELKNENQFWTSQKVKLFIGKYNINSRYTAKNVSRYIQEKDEPLVIPYNILYSDYATEGKVVDYFLKLAGLESESTKDGKDAYFIGMCNKTGNSIDYSRKEADYGMI